MRILIDADPIVYSCGFAAERRYYRLRWVDVVVADDPDFDKDHVATFHSAERCSQFIEYMNLHPDEYVREQLSVPEPLPYALHLVKRRIVSMVQAVEDELKGRAEAVELFLTDSGSNFRLDVATIKPYKGNRTQAKPHWYHEIREYLVSRWGAKVIRGMEADDAVAMVQRQSHDAFSTIICTVDKDLLMVPGFQYNYNTRTMHYVDEEQAIRAFYTQLLTGDVTDNIQGVPGIGGTRARRIISGVPFSPSHTSLVFEQNLYAAVYDQYRKKYPTDEAAAAALLENARLLWMQEYPGQLWTPPGHPDELIEGFSDD